MESLIDPLLWREAHNHILTEIGLAVLGLYSWKKNGFKFASVMLIFVVLFHEGVWGLLYTIRYNGPWWWIFDYCVLLFVLFDPKLISWGLKKWKYLVPCLVGFALWFAYGLPVVYKPSFAFFIASPTKYLNDPWINAIEIGVWYLIIIPFFWVRKP